ncbi:MAG: hypothetical protein HY319_17235 [Armatimonadetes bacterium]|nr:hypothetical protein [Armatimonadota bacterium]
MRLYNLNRLIRMFLDDHPDWSWDLARDRAIVLRRELHRLDQSWYRSNNRYRDHNTPFGDYIDDPGCLPDPDHPEEESDDVY